MQLSVLMMRSGLDILPERSSSLSKELLDDCARPVSEPALRQASRLILDWCGNSLAATGESSARSIRASVLASAGNGRCTAFATGRLPPEQAAFVNGSLGTLLEMDDLHRASIMHAGNVVIPAALASAQFHDTSGHRLLEAVVMGYELALTLGTAAAMGGYTAWYNSSTCGVFGAALAAAHAAGASDLVKLDALGQAGMQASGLWQCRLEPTDSKSVATAHAARAGVTSAFLAQHGVRGAHHIIEGPLGFFASYYPNVPITRALSVHKQDWLVNDVSFKPWPACRHVHPSVGLALQLRDVVRPEDISRIHIESYADALNFCDNPDPQTPHEARFSLQHCVAVALATGSIEIEHAGPATLSDPKIKRLRRITTVSEAYELTARFPDNTGARIDIFDMAGRKHSSTSHYALGDPEDPLDRVGLEHKFHKNLGHAGIAADHADHLAQSIFDLAQCKSLDQLNTALNAVTASQTQKVIDD